MHETYIRDRHALGVREEFRAAENLAAYRAIVDRMLGCRKGYWQAASETVAALREVQPDLSPAVMAEIAAIAQRAAAQPAPAAALGAMGPPATVAPASAATAAPAASAPIIRGRILEEKRRDPLRPRSTPLPFGALGATGAGLGGIALLLIALGWWREGRRGEGKSGGGFRNSQTPHRRAASPSPFDPRLP